MSHNFKILFYETCKLNYVYILEDSLWKKTLIVDHVIGPLKRVDLVIFIGHNSLFHKYYSLEGMNLYTNKFYRRILVTIE